MMRTAYSPGWGRDIVLGPVQSAMTTVLEGIAARDPGGSWHELPPTRTLGEPGSVSRTLHRLAELGVIALEVRRGRYGGLRFTFRPRRWKWSAPARRALTLARMKLRSVGQAVADFLKGRRQLPLPLAPAGPVREAGTSRPPGPSLFTLAMVAAGIRPELVR